MGGWDLGPHYENNNYIFRPSMENSNHHKYVVLVKTVA